MITLTTPRLQLLPATPELARAEIADRPTFSRLLGASIPENWPPETLADALEFFLRLLETNPTWQNWLAWYALAALPEAGSTLVGSVGFKGPPGQDGAAEIGYSVLPQFQGQGYATEMAAGLIGWARPSGRARVILAQTALDNFGSQRVLGKLGFIAVGPGEEPESRLYRLAFPTR